MRAKGRDDLLDVLQLEENALLHRIDYLNSHDETWSDFVEGMKNASTNDERDNFMNQLLWDRTVASDNLFLTETQVAIAPNRTLLRLLAEYQQLWPFYTIAADMEGFSLTAEDLIQKVKPQLRWITRELLARGHALSMDMPDNIEKLFPNLAVTRQEASLKRIYKELEDTRQEIRSAKAEGKPLHELRMKEANIFTNIEYFKGIISFSPSKLSDGFEHHVTVLDQVDEHTRDSALEDFVMNRYYSHIMNGGELIELQMQEQLERFEQELTILKTAEHLDSDLEGDDRVAKLIAFVTERIAAYKKMLGIETPVQPELVSIQEQIWNMDEDELKQFIAETQHVLERKEKVKLLQQIGDLDTVTKDQKKEFTGILRDLWRKGMDNEDLKNIITVKDQKLVDAWEKKYDFYQRLQNKV